MINKILSIANLRLLKIYKRGIRHFGNEFYPRPSTTYIDMNWDKENLVGVEIGVMHGKNAESILKTLPIKKLYLIDDWSEKPESYEDCLNKLIPFPKKYKVIRENSNNAMDLIPNNVDFVYIDGEHSYTQVKKDIENYYPKLKKGGMLAGHDIDNGFYDSHQGVIDALIEFINKHKLKLHIQSPDWWIIKP